MKAVTTNAGEKARAVVVPFRPRGQVPRRVNTVRSTPIGELPLEVDGRVVVGDLAGALLARGLVVAYDSRTGALRVMRAEDAAKEKQP